MTLTRSTILTKESTYIYLYILKTNNFSDNKVLKHNPLCLITVCPA